MRGLEGCYGVERERERDLQNKIQQASFNYELSITHSISAVYIKFPNLICNETNLVIKAKNITGMNCPAIIFG